MLVQHEPTSVFMFPNIKTPCCKVAMCFNCKRTGYHDKCNDFDEAVDESECLVRCHKCRVILMKVEEAVTWSTACVGFACGGRMRSSCERYRRRICSQELTGRALRTFDKGDGLRVRAREEKRVSRRCT
jgi:hypothetical protein